MAAATPSPTPNPDAMKFTLDAPLAEGFNVTKAEDAAGNPFVTSVFETDGVVGVFGVNDFVTVTRRPGTDWEPIVAAVQAAAEAHL
jgi:hypothetical protein